MFELEDYSSSIHEGLFNKYADTVGPSLDFYVSDSMQDMLDVDIRAEIAHVVGNSSDLTASLDHALETISAINNNNNNSSSSLAAYNTNGNLLASSALHASPTAKWMGSSANSWSTTDYYADLGACVNPISVMPMINSTMSAIFNSPPPKSRGGATASSTSTCSVLQSNGVGGTVPASPLPERDPQRSHLTFSPAQMKVSAGSLRREQISSHIPKQISVPVSTVLANDSNSAAANNSSGQQRRNSSAVEAVRKDLATELRKGTVDEQNPKSAGLLVKLAPGIGGLTFANSMTYNKLKQQNSSKAANGAPLTANGNMVLKRDRESSPLQNMATLHTHSHAQNKRSLLQQSSATPKSIASAAHSPHHQIQQQQQQYYRSGSPCSSGRPSAASSPLSFSGAITPLSNTSNLVNIANNNNNSSSSSGNSNNVLGSVKPLQQKIKLPVVDSAFPKPAYSYSCLIALALKNSRAGSLPVSEIYSFLCQHFPYFENAPSGWKNSVRHNLSLNKCFEKIERPATNGNQRKGCRWAMNPERIGKMDEEVQKWSRKDPVAIRDAMVFPDHLEALERGEMKHGSADSDVEMDSQSEIEEASDLEEQDFDETTLGMLVEDDDELDEEEDEEEDYEEHDEAINHTNQTHHNLPMDHELLIQKSGDFDIEVDEFYEAIDLEDDKEAVRQAILNGHQVIELNPGDLNGHQSPKRARLDINYAIGPAGELEQQYGGQRVKVQQIQQHQLPLPVPTPTQPAPTHNRRKMPLVNRII